MNGFWTRLKDTFAKSGVGFFLLAIVAVIFLAWLRPSCGIGNGSFSLERLTGYGVSIIFFFYGISLSFQKLYEGLSNWRMHLVVQMSTFILFPLLIISIKPLMHSAGENLLWLGIFYLAALPSTVSSSVVMVSVAGGNIPAAVFNASISSLLGIFITPLWMGLFLDASGTTMDVSDTIGKLVIQVLLPVVLGMALNSRLGAWAARQRSRLKFFDQSVILLIIYTSFCHSFDSRLFDDLGGFQLLGLGAAMTGLFLLVMAVINLICRFFRFSNADRITVLFCGSKKSLVHGTVMSKVLFMHTASGGLILLPLMLYHALQLIMAGIIAQRIAASTAR